LRSCEPPLAVAIEIGSPRKAPRDLAMVLKISVHTVFFT